MKLTDALRPVPIAVLAISLCAAVVHAQVAALAEKPPMGWNSWDAYGESVKENDVRANAEWMAKNLKSFGWQYVVVDSGWYVTNHRETTNANDAQFNVDEFGRYIPAINTFPSAASDAGFRPLADYIHSLGLKFGLHILRGIPKVAVAKNLPIQGSQFHAQDAADTSDTCPWNPFNFGLDTTKPAAQAYYQSLGRQFAQWHVDFVKVDCISSRPYKGEEIRLFSQALLQAGRPMVLSLSPGPAPIEKAQEMAANAQMWRISDDEWDVWQSSESFPQGVNNQFERAALWAAYSRPGVWPDADMLAIGRLEPSAGWGQPRATRLSQDEQRTLLTLWTMFRSPLIMGGNLLLCDEWTKSLLTNAEVVAVDQHSVGNHAVETTEQYAVWLAQRDDGQGFYLALFNRSDAPQTMKYSWKELGLLGVDYTVRDVWEHKELGHLDSIKVTLPADASVLYTILAKAKSCPADCVLKSSRTLTDYDQTLLHSIRASRAAAWLDPDSGSR
jgi:alpha-galactosidase